MGREVSEGREPPLTQRAQRSKNSISLEMFNLDRKFESRSKIAISTSRFPHHKNRAAVGGSLEKFHSRLKFSISLEISNFLIFFLGTEKVPQRNCVTKNLPNVRVNFLVRFASKPLFYWVMTGNPRELFRNFFGADRATSWFCASFLATKFLGPLGTLRQKNGICILATFCPVHQGRFLVVRRFF